MESFSSQNSGLLVNEENNSYGSFVKEENSNPVKTITKTSIRHQTCANVIMFVYFATFFPMIVVTEQYIYSKLRDEYGFDNSTAQGNSSDCDLNDTEKKLQKKVQSESSLWMIALKVKFSRLEVDYISNYFP